MKSQINYNSINNINEILLIFWKYMQSNIINIYNNNNFEL